MNMFKKTGGFTLVELIVVIAILAILAGVAIPAYSGYIKKAQNVAVVTELDAIATAAQTANALGTEVTIKVDADSIDVSATEFASDFDDAFVMFYKGATDAGDHTFTHKLTLDGTDYEGGANWTRETGWTK